MQVDDLNGSISVVTDTELLDRLRTIRKGIYGAFTLSHQADGPSLHIHINNSFAYVHYFAAGTAVANAGYQATGMTPSECPKSVHFVQTDGCESDAFDMSHTAICSLEAVYDAATEFLHDPALPKCINWFSL